jgi:hypothetical protein
VVGWVVRAVGAVKEERGMGGLGWEVVEVRVGHSRALKLRSCCLCLRHQLTQHMCTSGCHLV